MPDDIDFEQAMAGVKRLHPTQNKSELASVQKQKRPHAILKEREAELEDSLTDFSGATQNEPGAAQLYFARGGIQGRTLRELKRGHHFHSDAIIDLHGYRLAIAEKELRKFLAKAKQRGTRHLLIIHGKGLHTLGGQSSLKAFCADWLQYRSEVLAYCSAQVEDGGSGALYVLLKKQS